MKTITEMKGIAMLTVLLMIVNVQYGFAQNELTAQQELEKSFFHGARTSDMELLEKFIESGVDINYQGENGYTALMVAAYNGQKEAVTFFLDNGADLCIKDKRGNTALMGAIVAAEDEISKLLLKKGNCDDSINQRTLEFATRFNRKEIITLLKKSR